MMLSRATQNRTATILRTLGVLLVVVVLLGPIFWIVLTAFKPLREVYTMSVFFTPTLENFRTIFAPPFNLGDRLWNSIVISLATVMIGVPCAMMAAYSFSRFPFKHKRMVFFGVLATQFIPTIVLALPMFLMFRQLGLIDTRIGMIWVNLSTALPFATWILKGFMDTVPVEMEEAAMMDGASRLRTLMTIVLPVSIPGVFIAAVFCFIFSWNDFLYALVLTKREAVTLPVTLRSFYTEEGDRWELMAATGTFILLPMFAISYALQRHFVHGATAGSDR